MEERFTVEVVALDEDARQRLSDAVKKLRGDRTQRSFADSIEIGQSTLAGWESCTGGTPSLDNLEKLAKLRNEYPEEFIAYLYGREISTITPKRIEEQLKTFPIKKLAALIVTIGSLLVTDKVVENFTKKDESDCSEITRLPNKKKKKS
jgi:transcriptional regulator with XRE-family HTH domain